MSLRCQVLPCFLTFACSIGIASLGVGAAAIAQESGSGFELHAHSHITAQEIGLPAYPGAELFKDSESDPTVDMGFSFGDTHFRLLAANYASADPANKVLNFYRRSLAHYGDVLECDHGEPVGEMKATRSGLKCDGGQGDQGKLYGKVNSSDDHELRAGTPERFRIVGIGERKDGRTRFGLVYVELPQNQGDKKSD